MTVQELIDELESCDGEAEVRFLAQPSWPFEYTIAAEASDRPDDLSSYRETPARRVLLSRAGRPATATGAPSSRSGGSGSRDRRPARSTARPRAARARCVRTGAQLPRRRAAGLQSDDEEKEAIDDGREDSSEG